MEYASSGKQFLNLIIDTIAIQVLSAIIGFVFGFAFVSYKIATTGEITTDDESTLNVLGPVFGLLAGLGYYVLMEAIFQENRR